ncbi:MAG TPA: sodium:proton antiporter, partial [Acidocella sp.]|nr:sodium:proton antiporter [Acidocella sp.]
MGQLGSIIPFAGVLLSFAILPGLVPRFWHRRMAAVILTWVVLGFALQVFSIGAAEALLALWQVTFAEFLPFIMLLLALYAIGGGIGIKGGPWGRPVGNLLLLIIGTILASVMGTIGAALLLIHPLLAANGSRFEKRHLVIA